MDHGKAQHRDALYLVLNNALGAATGLLFWLVVVRACHLDTAQVGIGYALIALSTLVGLLAKGGLDVALIRTVGAAPHDGRRLLARACVAASASAVAVTLAAAVATRAAPSGAQALGAAGWALVAVSAAVLAVTWLQDAYFLAMGQARRSVERNIVLSVLRLALPVVLVAAAVGQPVASAWCIALAASCLAAALRTRTHDTSASTLPAPGPADPAAGRARDTAQLWREALRNASGSAAEFLPGLLLAPLVLAAAGPEASAHFGMAWTAASLLFLLAAAIARSATATIARHRFAPGSHEEAAAVRRCLRMQCLLVLPLAAAGFAVGPFAIGVFGPGYAAAAGSALRILCASTILVVPLYAYIALLRSRSSGWPLLAMPAANIAALLALSPWMVAHAGLSGIAWAWTLANLPFGVWSAWRLWQVAGARDVPGLAQSPTASAEVMGVAAVAGDAELE